MGRQPYADDPGESEFTGDGQWSSEGHGGTENPGVGVLPVETAGLNEWYWTNPADPESAPEEGFKSIGDESVHRNRLGNPL
jgi:hypothetical protein